MASMLSVAVGNLVFGFSTNLYVAVAVRLILLGMCNGWVSLMGMCTLEVSGEAMQSVAFSYIISVGSITATLGPAVSGWTYGKLSRRFPALVPSLVGTAFGVCAIAITYAWLPETRPARQPTDGSDNADGADGGEGKFRSDEQHTGKGSGHCDGGRPSSDSCSDGRKSTQGALRRTRSSQSTDPQPRQRSLRRTLCEHPFPLVMLVRSGHGMAMFAAFDVVPLWTIATRHAGGLALVEEEVGSTLAFSSLLQFCFTALVMGRLVNRLGLYRSLVYGCAVAAVVTLGFPLIPGASAAPDRWRAANGSSASSLNAMANASSLDDERLAVSDEEPAADAARYYQAAAAAVLYSMQSSAMLLAGTSLISMSNVLCARDPQRSGSLNGVVAFMEGIGKMLGPALCAPLLAWALSSRPAATTSPSGVLITFVGLSIGIGSLALLAVLGLPRQLTNDPKALDQERPLESFVPLDEESSTATELAAEASEPSMPKPRVSWAQLK